MEIREGQGGRFGLGDLGGRGVTVIQEIWVRGGGKKPCHPSGGGGGVWIFSGITQCHIPR